MVRVPTPSSSIPHPSSPPARSDPEEWGMRSHGQGTHSPLLLFHSPPSPPHLGLIQGNGEEYHGQGTPPPLPLTRYGQVTPFLLDKTRPGQTPPHPQVGPGQDIPHYPRPGQNIPDFYLSAFVANFNLNCFNRNGEGLRHLTGRISNSDWFVKSF